MTKSVLTLVTGDTSEHMISDKPCRLIAIVPEFTTTGTVTVRNDNVLAGSNVIHACAIGLNQVGKTFSDAGVRLTGLTVQLSANTDKVAIIWAPGHNG